MNLPNNESTFNVDIKGDTTGQRFTCQFTTVCVPTIAQKHQFELEKARLVADLQNPSDRLFTLASVLATLNIRLIKKPEWWTDAFGGLDLLDENVMWGVYDGITGAEKQWKEDVAKQAEGSPVDSSKTDEKETPAKTKGTSEQP